MFNKKFGAALLAILLVAVFLPVTAAAQTSVFIQEFSRTGPPEFDATGVQVSGAFINPCTADLVDVTGVTTITTSQGLDNRGNIVIKVGTVTKGKGVGWLASATGPVLTGRTYSFSESQSFNVKFPNDPTVSQAFESDFFDKISMRGAKSVDNWLIRARFRIKIAADGTVMVNLIKLNSGDGCRG